MMTYIFQFEVKFASFIGPVLVGESESKSVFLNDEFLVVVCIPFHPHPPQS